MYNGQQVKYLDYHCSLLADKVRCDNYRQAIISAVMPGNIVVDIGSGTGLLACFACEAGARRVYAIETGDIIEIGRIFCKANGYADRIVWIQGMSTSVTLPETADVLVTETLWNFGLGEGILSWVHDAQKRFLKPGANIVPHHVQMFLVPLESPALHAKILGLWQEHRYGLDFSCVYPFAANNLYNVDLNRESFLSQPQTIADIDIAQFSGTDIDREICFSVQRSGVVCGLGGWFCAKLSANISVSNQPPNQTPSWRQVFLPVSQPFHIDAGEQLKIRLKTAGSGAVWHWRLVSSHSHASHSNFLGFPCPLTRLRSMQPNYIPQLSQHGQAEFLVLQMCQQKQTRQVIRQCLAEKYPDLFACDDKLESWLNEIFSRIAE